MQDLEKRLEPFWFIEVARDGTEKRGKELPADMSRLVQKVEYESSEDIIDCAKLTVSNPDFKVSSAKLFIPGHELLVFVGYANKPRLAGRVVIANVRPNYPRDGMPTMEVVAYSKAYQMKENRPNPKAQGKRTPKPAVYMRGNVADFVWDRCREYGLKLDIDGGIEWPKEGIVQPARMSDFEAIQALANMLGFVWWVDWDFDDGWSLHFRDPKALKYELQEKSYTFVYNKGSASTLLSFEPEMLFDEHYTEIVVQAPGIKEPIYLKEESGVEADPNFELLDDEIDGRLVSAEAVKFYFNNFSFAVMPRFSIRNSAQLKVWAQQYFRKMRDFFIVGNGQVIGLESLAARQTHELTGIGQPYDGKYYFSRVRHQLSSDSEYVCDFSARKVVE